MLEWYEILLRLFTAALLGGIIGFERERKDWAAGIRTHMMACMGSSLVMMVSSFGFTDILGYPNVSLDPSRVASSVIIGIGYLGAGIILVLKRGNIKGLTTASGFWATAGVGLAAGGGMYFTAAAATLIALLILYVIQRLQIKMAMRTTRNALLLTLAGQEQLDLLLQKIKEHKMNMRSLDIRYQNNKIKVELLLTSTHNNVLQLVDELRSVPGIEKIRLS